MQNFKTTQDIVDHIIFKSFIKMSAPIMYRKILKVVSRNSPIFSASIFKQKFDWNSLCFIS